ncbi:hypothetical protein DSUL_50433 [Desulfovibrionales bacterium]
MEQSVPEVVVEVSGSFVHRLFGQQKIFRPESFGRLITQGDNEDYFFMISEILLSASKLVWLQELFRPGVVDQIELFINS